MFTKYDGKTLNAAQSNNCIQISGNSGNLAESSSRFSIVGSNASKSIKRKTKETDHIRSSLMLAIVLILFFIAEFPQAILLFISIFNHNVYLDIYKPLGDVMDVLVLINYSICFTLYCSMGREFRESFYSYFKLKN